MNIDAGKALKIKIPATKMQGVTFLMGYQQNTQVFVHLREHEWQSE